MLIVYRKEMLRPVLLLVCRQLASTNKFHLVSANHKSFVIKDTDDFLKNVMNSHVPVVVNFYADWCGPCHKLTPKLKELVEARDDINFAMVDIEKHADLVYTFAIRAIPAVIAIRDGFIIDKFIGLVDNERINLLIHVLLPPSKRTFITTHKTNKNEDSNKKR